MEEIKNYYQILEIKFTDSNEAIKEAYKRLAFKYHPDRNKEENYTSKMQEINEAYQVLKNPNSKKIYDATYQEYFSNETKNNIQNINSSQELKDIVEQAKKEAQKIVDNIVNAHKDTMDNININKNQLSKQILFYLIGFFSVGILMKGCS